MGLDIYAGTLTRYYTHNWKTSAQQWAEEHGMGFSRITPTGEPLEAEEVSPAAVRAGMESWRDQVLAAISPQKPLEPWEEDNERPYYTDKPDWDAFGALLLVAACHTYGEPVPETVAKGWDYMAHPLISRLAGDPERVWSLFRGAEWWLPLPEGMLFQIPLPTGDRRVVATTALLRWELERLNNMAWQAEEETILRWSRTEGYPADGELGPGGALTMGETHLSYDADSLAKYAFSILYQALDFAEKNRVPVLLDY